LEQQLDDAQSTIRQMEEQLDKDQKDATDQDSLLVDLQSNLQTQMGQRAEAEDKARRAIAAAKSWKEQVRALKTESKTQMEQLEATLAKVTKSKAEMQSEFEATREERDEHCRKEASLALRLNVLNKVEAEKANAVKHYEDQAEFLKKELESTKEALSTTTNERGHLKDEVAQWKEYAENRSKQLEAALAKEKKLNNDRKRKMKEFVEAKTDEVRAAKSDTVGLQTEMDQTNMTLKDLNQRYKQLHAQWVESQTRNRELQRDVTKMKKDSEKMSQVGGTLEAKLSRSAMESQDHKNKRMAAKNELMAVLRQLEAERDVNNRLRERIKISFTPKALSQQQSIQEILDELEGTMLKVATKLGRILPPPAVTGNELSMDMMGGQTMEGADVTATSSGESAVAVSEANTQRVLNKLDNETKRVSRCIDAISNSAERLQSLVAAPSTRSCVDVFSALLMASQPDEETAMMTGSGVRR
jgi:chromosome segregation ATPase